MRRISKYLLALSLLLMAAGAWGQSPADSLTVEQVGRLRIIAEWKSKWDLARELTTYFLPIISFLLGGALTYLGLKARFQKWAEEEITKKASEKIGVDWGIVKKLVDEKRTLLDKRSKVTVAIINHSTGERSELDDLITNLGYPKPKFFTFIKKEGDSSVRSYESDFKKGDFKFLIIDNHDGKLSEDDGKKIIESNKNAFDKRIIWYTKGDLTIFGELTKAGYGVVKQASRFQIELDDRLPVF